MTAIKSLKILLVEDEPIAMFANRNLLLRMGYTPDTAETGKEALSMALANQPYDVILMDIGLPDINGIQVARKIRQREQGQKPTCIIALTAYIEDEELKTECLLAGMNDIAGKPISPSDLEALINKYTVHN